MSKERFLAQYGPSEYILKGLDERNFYTKKAALKNPEIKPEHLDHALKQRSHSLNNYVLVHPKLSKENIDTAIEHCDIFSIDLLKHHKNITPEQVKKIDLKKKEVYDFEG